jgi:hypothetical protein
MKQTTVAKCNDLIILLLFFSWDSFIIVVPFHVQMENFRNTLNSYISLQ